MNRIAMAAAAALTLGACATVQKPAMLTQAEEMYAMLEGRAATEEYAEAEMIRARSAIDSAQTAFNSRRNQNYVNGLAHIALRRAEIAKAELEGGLAAEQADSLRDERMQRLLLLSESQRAQLMQEQALSAEEIAALRERNLLVSQRADSLRRVAEAAEARLNDALVQLRTLVAEITNIRETTRGLVINLSDILFDVDKATLKAGAEQNIARIAAILNQYPDYQISVEGHTDATGSDSYNQSLSERRAAAVRASLVSGGVDPSRITSKGLGEAQPIATNDTPAGRQQNRRVEVIVLGAGTLADAANSPPPTMPDTSSMGRPPR
ncbi:MAG: OmpA family protein [Gemmatimonadaceae bacterium]